MKASDEQIAIEYMQSVGMALDQVSLRHGERGDMGAALAALCACQAQLIAQLPDGRLRKEMRNDCAKKLLQYLTASLGDDKRGAHKPSISVLPPEVH